MDLFAHLHPKLVHFPIALFMGALAFEILSYFFKKERFHQTAVHIYVFAALSAPFVVQTGLWEAEEHQLRHEVLDWHKLFGLWTMWTALASLPVLYLVKEKFIKYFRITFLIFCLCAVSLVALTADKGGILVFEYGIGVEE